MANFENKNHKFTASRTSETEQCPETAVSSSSSLLPSPWAAHVAALERSSVAHAKPILIRILERTHGLPSGFDCHLTSLRLCGIKKKIVRGMSVGRWRCGRPWCPACRPWDATLEAIAATRKLLRRVGGVPEQSELFWVTVRPGVVKQPGSDFSREAWWFKRELQRFRQIHMADSAWLGSLHLSLANNQQLNLHAHMLVWFPGGSQSLLEELLRAQFTGPRAVQVASMKSKQPVLINMLKTLFYAPSIDMRVKGLAERTGTVLAEWITSLESVCRTGRQGLRLQWGVTRKKVQHDFVVARETGDAYLLDRTTGEVITVPEWKPTISKTMSKLNEYYRTNQTRDRRNVAMIEASKRLAERQRQELARKELVLG
jgi:hypothetical protein